MKKKLNIIFCLISIISIISVNPAFVYALENNSENITNNSENKINMNFNYKFDIRETLNVLYKNRKIEDYLQKVIQEKNGIEYQININLSDTQQSGTYTLSKNNEQKSAIFTYEYTEEFEVNLGNQDKLTSIKNYIKENIEVIEDISVVNKVDDLYTVTIGENTHDFKVIFNENLKKEEVEPKFAEENPTDYSIVPYAQTNDVPTVSYSTHVETHGWQNYIENGALGGTTGEGKRLEAIKIKLSNVNNLSGSIEYQTHVESIGWQSYVANDALAGTTNQAKQLEAIRIRLTDELAANYDIYYRVHVSEIGWLDWASNGKIAGTVGYGKQLEAIEIRIVKKGESAPGAITKPSIQKPLTIFYSTHVETYGWQDYVENGALGGTTGEGKRLEAIKIKLLNQNDLSGNIEYQTHVESIGWQNFVANDALAGTENQAKQLEAIRIRLTDELAANYDIYYRVHVSEIGWLNWASNGAESGTSGFGKQLEAIEIKLQKKGEPALDNGGNAYIEKGDDITYSAHVSTIGWQDYVENGDLIGTTGKALPIESIKINLNATVSGSVNYQTYVENVGWQSQVSNNEISGTVGKGKHIEGIKINLTGDIALYYDVYYRTHVSSIGWLDWASNGQKTGTNGIEQGIEAIEILLVAKGAEAPGDTTTTYLEGTWKEQNGQKYYYNYWGQMADDFKVIDGVKYFFNSLGVLIGSNVQKVIDISKYQGNIDWDTLKAYGNIDGVIVRLSSGVGEIDPYFARNIAELNRVGIPYGIYIYSEAGINGITGADEAQWVLDIIRDPKYNVHLSLPIYYDLEQWASKKNSTWTVNEYRPIVESFDRVMTSAGLNSSWAIYANKSWAENKLYEWANRITWVAQYNHYCTYDKTYYNMWQFSSTEQVPGINGNVDVNVRFL